LYSSSSLQLATKGAEYASKILFRIGFDVDFLGSGGQSAEVGEGLPRARQVELAELLRQFHRLHNHTLGLVIVTHLDESGQREVLAEGVAFESVVGEDAPEVGVVGEEDAVHVPDLTLVPVGRLVDIEARVDRRQLVCVRLDADSRVEAQREQIVDQLRPEETKKKLVRF